jgi:hypothetical protein
MILPTQPRSSIQRRHPTLLHPQTHSPPPAPTQTAGVVVRRPLLFPTSDPFAHAPDPLHPRKIGRRHLILPEEREPPPLMGHGGAAGLFAGARVVALGLRRTSLPASRAWQAVRCGCLHSGEVAPAASTRAADVRRPPSSARSRASPWRRGPAVLGGHRPGRPAGVAHRPPPRQPASSQESLVAPDLQAPVICDLDIGMQRSIFFSSFVFSDEKLRVPATAQLDIHAVMKLNIAHSSTAHRNLI